MTPYYYQSYSQYVSRAATQTALDIIVSRYNITDLQPTKTKYGGITRAGLFSYFGFIGSKKVKIYSSFTTEQANLRVAMNQCELVCRFPQVLGQQDNVLIDEWVDGDTLDTLPMKQISAHAGTVAQFMRELQMVDVSQFGADIYGFDYLDYLILRINHSDKASIVREYNNWQSREISVPSQLSHNDLFDDNLVFDGTHLYVVDNEMLSVSKGWFLSWRNSFLHRIQHPVPGYSTGVPQDLMVDTWALRKLGTKLLGART